MFWNCKTTGQRCASPKLSPCGPSGVSKLSHSCAEVVPKELKVYKRRPYVVPKLSQCFLKVIPCLYPSCSNWCSTLFWCQVVPNWCPSVINALSKWCKMVSKLSQVLPKHCPCSSKWCQVASFNVSTLPRDVLDGPKRETFGLRRRKIEREKGEMYWRRKMSLWSHREAHWQQYIHTRR